MSDGLSVEDLTVRLGGVPVVDSVSLSVAPGEILALLGPSGCGKSTLLRAIAGLEPDIDGAVRWAGVDVTDVAVHQRDFGMMFQGHSLFPHKSVADNVGFGPRLRGRSPDEVRARVAELLDQVGLAGFGSRSVNDLSGGEAQRVALARALAPSPRLLLLDEPLASLDRPRREDLIEDLAGLRQRMSVTAIHVTHDRDEAFALADRLAVMRDGRLVATGTPEQLWKQPPSAWVARFLGHPNVVDAGDDHPAYVIPLDAISLDPDGDDGVVTDARFTPTGFLVRISGDNGSLTARVASRPSPGDRVGIVIDRSGTIDIYEDADQPR